MSWWWPLERGETCSCCSCYISIPAVVINLVVFWLLTLYLCLQHTMGMSHLKVTSTSQGPIHTFTSLKRKLYNCNANIYFNQQCLKKKLTPAYTKIKIPNTSPACKYTQHKQPIWELEMKQQLNQQIYRLHLVLNNTWYNTWQYMLHTQSKVNSKIQK